MLDSLPRGAVISASPAASQFTPFGNEQIRHQDIGVTIAPYASAAPDAHLSGVVYGRDGPVARKVTLSPEAGRGPSYTFVTADDGRYDLPAVRPGIYIIHDELIEGRGGATLRLDLLTIAPGETDVVVDISAQSFRLGAGAEG